MAPKNRSTSKKSFALHMARLGAICFRAVFWVALTILVLSIFILFLKAFDDTVLICLLLNISGVSSDMVANTLSDLIQADCKTSLRYASRTSCWFTL